MTNQNRNGNRLLSPANCPKETPNGRLPVGDQNSPPTNRPLPPFRIKPAAPVFDDGCWFEAYGGAAIGLQAIVDRHEDDR
jgi:hypothetical protein